MWFKSVKPWCFRLADYFLLFLSYRYGNTCPFAESCWWDHCGQGSNRVSLSDSCIFMFSTLSPSLCLCISPLFLRAMWPFPVLNQFPLLWRSLTHRASSSCQDWHRGHRGFSMWRCSSGRGTRRGSSWPSSSHSRGALSGCTWMTPDSAYRSVKLAGPSCCWVRVRSLEFLQRVVK